MLKASWVQKSCKYISVHSQFYHNQSHHGDIAIIHLISHLIVIISFSNFSSLTQFSWSLLNEIFLIFSLLFLSRRCTFSSYSQLWNRRKTDEEKTFILIRVSDIVESVVLQLSWLSQGIRNKKLWTYLIKIQKKKISEEKRIFSEIHWVWIESIKINWTHFI